MFEQEEVDKLALKVAEAIGEDLLTYTTNQIRAFEQAMGRLLKRRNGQSGSKRNSKTMLTSPFAIITITPISVYIIA